MNDAPDALPHGGIAFGTPRTRRLCDTLCHGAGLAVVPYASAHEISHWERLGFDFATPGADEGYLCLRLAHRTARIDDPDKPWQFKVLPNLSPEDMLEQN